MQRFLYIFFISLATKIAFAQPSNPTVGDSLKRVLSKQANDTTKVLILEKLTGFYTNINPILALRYGRDAWILASKLRYDKGKILSAISSAQIMLGTSDYSEALFKLTEAKFLSEKNNMPKELTTINLKFALLYTNRKQFKTALEYLSKAKKIQDSLHISASEMPLNLTSGFVYKDMKKNDSALYFFKNAYKYSLKNNLTFQLPTITYYIGSSFWELKQKDSALFYFRKSLSLKAAFNEGRVFYGLASIFKATNQTDSSIFYAKKALIHSHQNNHLQTAIFSAQLLSEIYEKKNDLKESLHYYKITTADKDSLFSQEQVRQIERLAYEEQERESQVQRKVEVHQKALESEIKIYALLVLLIMVLIVVFFLYRNNKNKHRANHLLHIQKEEIDTQRDKAEKALHDLKTTQVQLIQSEKLASLGELTAGIAHEIQNPLNFVNNFSELSIDIAKELKEEIEKLEIPEKDKVYIDEIIGDLTQNQEKINHHGKRASSIVKGMLQHSRTSAGEKELTDINALADEYIRLSFHGLRAKDKTFNADFKTDFDENLPKIEVIPQEIGRVLLNLFNNAFYASASLKNQENFKPKVTVSTRYLTNPSPKVEIRITDNGTGMSSAIKAKIFQPFFTTKPAGEGTGLGLSLAYDIITKGHGGTIEVESTEGQGTTFIITI